MSPIGNPQVYKSLPDRPFSPRSFAAVYGRAPPPRPPRSPTIDEELMPERLNPKGLPLLRREVQELKRENRSLSQENEKLNRENDDLRHVADKSERQWVADNEARRKYEGQRTQTLYLQASRDIYQKIIGELEKHCKSLDNQLQSCRQEYHEEINVLPAPSTEDGSKEEIVIHGFF